jgi:prepilin-type N-terminal cleavage/methylation domain-containing protein
MTKGSRSAFTLVEVLIVVVIMAVLAAAIIPQFTDSTKDAKISTAKFNVHALRGQLELYKAQHSGEYPDVLSKLAVKTNVDHTTTGTPTLGPYVGEIPNDSVTGSAAVAATTDNPIAVTGTTGGWIYNKATGEIRINHSDYDTY